MRPMIAFLRACAGGCYKHKDPATGQWKCCRCGS